MTTSNAQEKAFEAAVAASESTHQSDIKGASVASIRAAELAHWTRIIAAAAANGINAPNVADAIRTRNSGYPS